MPKHQIIRVCIAAIWLVNGLLCKVLNLVPRHQEIVARILGDAYAHPLTILIGICEIGMGIWILTGKWSRWNAIAQMLVIGVMNLLEFILVPDLLLWGRMNALFAAILILVVYINEFHLSKSPAAK